MTASRRPIAALTLAVACLLLLLIRPTTAYLHLQTIDGDECTFGGAHDNYVVTTCTNSTGAQSIYVWRCLKDLGGEPTCATLAIIQSPDLTPLGSEFNSTGIQVARAVVGNDSYTAIAATIYDPVTGWTGTPFYYCAHFDPDVDVANCSVIYGMDIGGFNNNPVGHIAWDPEPNNYWQYVAITRGIAPVWDITTATMGVSIYKCNMQMDPDGFPWGLCTRTLDISYYPYPYIINFTVALSDAFLAVGDPMALNGRGVVHTRDCTTLYAGAFGGSCVTLEDIAAPNGLPGDHFGGGVILNPEIPDSTQRTIIAASPGAPLPLGAVGGYSTLLCDALSDGGGCTVVQFWYAPFIPDNGPTVSPNFGAGYGLSSVLTDSSTVTVYIGAQHAHVDLGEVYVYTCGQGIVCAKTRASIFADEGVVSDGFGGSVGVTDWLTAVGSHTSTFIMAISPPVGLRRAVGGSATRRASPLASTLL